MTPDDNRVVNRIKDSQVEAALGVLRNIIRMNEAQADVDGGKKATQYQRGRADVSRHTARELHDLLSVLTEALAERGWRPIESAPRDGSCVLLADSDSVTPGFYHDGSECYGHRGGAGFFDEADRGSLLTASNFHATHWQPLPEPPHDR